MSDKMSLETRAEIFGYIVGILPSRKTPFCIVKDGKLAGKYATQDERRVALEERVLADEAKPLAPAIGLAWRAISSQIPG